MAGLASQESQEWRHRLVAGFSQIEGYRCLSLIPCVSSCEVPVGFGVSGIVVVLPGGDFVDEGLFVGDAAVEALGR